MERKAAGSDTNAMMTRDVGLPLARAVTAFAAGRYGDAIALLLPIRTIANRFGGSHAQRDLIHLTLVEAALRARHNRLARALIAERTQLKPSSPFNWQLTARCDGSQRRQRRRSAERWRAPRRAGQGAVRSAPRLRLMRA